MRLKDTNATGDIEKFNHWSETYEESWLQHLYFDRLHKGVLSFVNAESTPFCIVDSG